MTTLHSRLLAIATSEAVEQIKAARLRSSQLFYVMTDTETLNYEILFADEYRGRYQIALAYPGRAAVLKFDELALIEKEARNCTIIDSGSSWFKSTNDFVFAVHEYGELVDMIIVRATSLIRAVSKLSTIAAHGAGFRPVGSLRGFQNARNLMMHLLEQGGCEYTTDLRVKE